MTPELKAKWIEALRSGRYEQGVGSLFDSGDKTYCCLGVLCDIHPDISLDGDEYFFGRENQGILLGPKFCKAVGITKEQAKRLATMNDSEQWSFKEIADAIEKDEIA
jgi:hypothetical protein